MSDCLRAHIKTLKLLKKSSPKARKNILKNANKSLIRCLCEVSQNILNRNVPINNSQFKKLCRHRNTLRALAKRGQGWKQKKKIVNQSGGWVLPLLAPLLGIFLQKIIT